MFSAYMQDDKFFFLNQDFQFILLLFLFRAPKFS